MNREENIFNDLDLKKVSLNFTKNVMQDIYALENEKSLNKLITKESRLEVSNDFTQNVIQKIDLAKAKKKRKKILNRNEKLAFFIIPIITLVSLLVLPSSKNATYFEALNFSILDKLSFFSNSEFASLLPIVFISITALLFFDFLIHKKSLSNF